MCRIVVCSFVILVACTLRFNILQQYPYHTIIIGTHKMLILPKNSSTHIRLKDNAAVHSEHACGPVILLADEYTYTRT